MATDCSGESLTADAATVQPPVAALTQPPCRAVTSSRKINTTKAVKGEIRAGPHGLTGRDWCVINVGQLNKVITDVFCPVCHSVGTLSVMKSGQSHIWDLLNTFISSVQIVNMCIRRPVFTILPS